MTPTKQSAVYRSVEPSFIKEYQRTTMSAFNSAAQDVKQKAVCGKKENLM